MQFRKGTDRTPYINHPIQVAELLVNYAGEKDPILLSAAILHDVIEDTVITQEEKQELINEMNKIFGDQIHHHLLTWIPLSLIINVLLSDVRVLLAPNESLCSLLD
jgi:(p)ppGpp synthase/HD superfamily hydrolase